MKSAEVPHWGLLEPCLRGYFPERTTMLVNEQPGASISGCEDVGPTVVVDVADCDPLPVAEHLDARLNRHVVENPGGRLAEQLAGGASTLLTTRREEHVQAPILIEIDDGSAATGQSRHEVGVPVRGVGREVEA